MTMNRFITEVRYTLPTMFFGAALFISGSALAAATATKDTEITTKSFNVAPGGSLRIDADLANVKITTRESATVDVKITRRLKFDAGEAASDLLRRLSIETAQNGNEVQITVRFEDEKAERERNKIELDFEIAMPRQFNVNLRTGGSASIGDVDGAVDATTAGGSLKLGNVSGAVTAKSGGGSLSIGDVGGGLNARSGGGSIKAGRVTGAVTAQAGGGSVAIEEATDSIDASAAGGSIKASISQQPRSACRFTAEGGSVDLRLPASVAVTVDASCTAGRIATDFDLVPRAESGGSTVKGAINGGGPAVEIRATAGSISLRKRGNE